MYSGLNISFLSTADTWTGHSFDVTAAQNIANERKHNTFLSGNA